MAQSFVRQGVNIVCSNMTISSPRKLGLHPDKELMPKAGITIHSASSMPLLNILDKKLDDCFKCKMPKKVWGGLAAFFAGVAIVAIVVVVVVTAPVSGPVVAAIAGVASVTTAVTVGGVATVGAIAATSYAVYKLNHECDKIFDADWEDFHPGVRIEEKNALLNKSFLICPVGGKLNIIIDDVLASEAAKLISGANSKEVWFHWGSKFINGVLAFSLGGPIGVTIASGLEIYGTVTDDGISNKEQDVWGDSVDALSDHAVSTAAEAAAKQSLINQGGSKILDVVIAGMGKGVFTEAQGDAVLNWLVTNGEPFSWKGLGTNFLRGLGGAVAGFAIDQISNSIEEQYEVKAGDSLKALDLQDESAENSISVIAATQ